MRAAKLTQCFLFQLSKEKLKVVPNEADEEQSRECSSVAYTVFITELFSQGVRRVYLHQSTEINARIIPSSI